MAVDDYTAIAPPMPDPSAAMPLPPWAQPSIDPTAAALDAAQLAPAPPPAMPDADTLARWGYSLPSSAPPVQPPSVQLPAPGFGPIPESALVPPAPTNSGPQPPPVDLTHEQTGAIAPAASPAPLSPQAPGQQATAPTPSEADVDAQARALANDPYTLARKEAIARQAYIDQQTALQAKALADDKAAAVRNLAGVTAASQKAQADTQQLVSDSTNLANTKIDPDLHQGVLGSIATVIGLTLGGAMSQYTGGRNLALEQLNKAIDNHIAAQKDNLANQWKGLGMRKEAIADAYAQHGDLYRAQETFRVGALQRAQNEIATTMQNFDPNGTTVRQLAQSYNSIDAARQQAVAQFQQTRFNNQIKLDEVSQKVDAANLEQQNKTLDRQQKEADSVRTTGLGYSRIASEDKRAANELAEKAAARLAAKDTKATEDWAEKGLGDPATGEPMVTAQGAPMIAQARALAAKGDDAGAAELRKQAALKYGVKIGNKEDATKVQSQIAFAQGMSDLRSKIHAQLDSDPGVTNREAWAGIDTDFQNLKIQYIRLNDGKPSSREMDAMGEVFGASPSEINVRLIGQGKLKAHVDHVVDNAINDTSTLLKAKGVEGGWQPTPLTTYKPAPTPADQLETQALAAHPSDMGALDTAADDVKSTYDNVTYGIPAMGALDLLRKVPGANSVIPILGMTGGATGGGEQRQVAIQQLGRQAEVSIDPAESQKYITALRKVAKDGRTSSDRELAQRVLDNFAAARVRQATPDVVESPTSRLDGDTQSSEAPAPEPNTSEAADIPAVVRNAIKSQR